MSSGLHAPSKRYLPSSRTLSNLEEITPPWLGFKTLSMSTDSIEEGTVIRYRLRLHGIRHMCDGARRGT